MKGSILDLPLIIAAVFMFSIAVLTSSMILTEFQDNTKDIETSSGNKINQTLLDQGQTAIQALDFMIMFAVIGLTISTIIFSFFIKTHPVFFVMSVILLMVFVLISVFVTNTFVEFVSVEPFSNTINNFPLMYEILTNLPLITTVMGIIIPIALYAKSKTGDKGL